MKKIGIDARLYSQTGVGVYIRNLLYYLEELASENITFYIYLIKDDFDKINFKKNNFIKRLADYKWHSFSEQLGFLNMLNKDNLDLMHFTYFSYPVFYKRPFIATIHDVTLLLFKTGRASTKSKFEYSFKHFVFKQTLTSQVKNALKIITPTKTVKDQLIRIFGDQYKNKIIPIYEGVNHELIETASRFEKSEEIKLNKPFFIYVGNFYPHKNVENLIKAFAYIKEDVQLVLIGPKDYFGERLFQYINISKQKEKFKFVYDFSLDKLIYFYKNALALIHPSLSEGFGLPIIEAVYFNCPIIASNIDVFKELLNGQYLAFDPNNIEDLRFKIEEFLKNKQSFNYKKIIDRFSFKKMTENIIKIYENCHSL